MCCHRPRGVGSGWTVAVFNERSDRKFGGTMAQTRPIDELAMIDAKIRDCERRIAEQKRRLESISKSLSTRQDSEKLHKNLAVSLKVLQELRRLVMMEVEEAEKGHGRFFWQ
jgi:hypothetical protein